MLIVLNEIKGKDITKNASSKVDRVNFCYEKVHHIHF